MEGQDQSRLLVVEGKDDLHAIVHLMKAHVAWPARPPYPVHAKAVEGVEKILERKYLSTELKAAAVKAVGVVLDADEGAERRYERVRQVLGGMFPVWPERMPREGLVLENEDGRRFGLWVMPDNESAGDLETFLRFLVPASGEGLWGFGCECVGRAQEMGSGCGAAHVTKANLYTWLAWQEPPGQSPGLAVTRRVLDPDSVPARVFVRWFRELYQI